MSSSPWMACALLLAGAWPLSAVPAERAGPIEQATSKAYCSPASVQIGEPFSLVLDIVHDPQMRVLLHKLEGQGEAGAEQPFGAGWELLEPQSSVRLPLGDGSGRQLTQVRWRLFALEAGEFELPTVGADCVASGALQRLEAPNAKLLVRGELVAEEDSARPMLGFREPPDEVANPLGTIVMAIGIGWGLLVLLLIGILIARRRPRQRAARPPTALERLESFDPADETAIRDLHFGVSKIVRSALEQEESESLDGCTDEEWLVRQRQSSTLSPDLMGRAGELLERCGEVKYASGSPTRWAAEETLKAASTICADAMKERQEASA